LPKKQLTGTLRVSVLFGSNGIDRQFYEPETLFGSVVEAIIDLTSRGDMLAAFKHQRDGLAQASRFRRRQP
jgi:hypothetical protein